MDIEGLATTLSDGAVWQDDMHRMQIINAIKVENNQQINRLELLAEAIEKIAVNAEIIKGDQAMTGPQVLMIADDCAEWAKAINQEL